MKITKNQLRRIIKEERAKLIAEQQGYRHPDTGEDMIKMLSDIVDKLMETDIDLEYLANEIHGLAQDVEEVERQRAVKTGPGGGSRFVGFGPRGS